MSRGGIGLIGLGGLFGTLGVLAVLSTPSRLVSAPAPQQVGSASADAQPCTQLVGRTFADATVDRAEILAKGSITSPLKTRTSVEVCRVSIHASPGPDSKIEIDLWLPAKWNGKLFGVGGGGFNGGIASDPLLLTSQVNKGYAGVATDAGHATSDHPLWALGHPQKIADFGYRSNHEAAIVAKAVLAFYYRKPLRHAYFHGCSNGGRDALMLAERYPGDYDGIIVGAPANDWTGLFAAFMHDREALEAFGDGPSLAAKLQLVHDAAIRQCDGDDGAKDGLLSNPEQCRFDPVALQCKSGARSDCLTPQEVRAVRAIYEGTRGRRGRLIMPGFERGSEYQWDAWMPAPKGAAAGMGPDFYRYMVYDDPKWNPSEGNVDRDYQASKRKVGAALDAINPDLRPFIRRGGRLLMYHGWDDAAIPPANSIRFYTAVRRQLGASADRTRLFMVPGMAHCWGGNGPSSFDQLGALAAWVEHGRAPDRLVAVKYDNDIAALAGLDTKVLKSRPICAWPKSPRYKGSGSLDDAASFVCR